jgi:regulator of nucleoside diphosphate kinase
MPKSKQRRLARPRIVVESSEHTRLLALAEQAVATVPQVATYLIEELTRAFIVPNGSCAANVVRIGSLVTYREDSTARLRRVRLSYPSHANLDEGRISILTPIGAALIGMSVAQSIEWPTPSGRTDCITVLDVSNDRL